MAVAFVVRAALQPLLGDIQPYAFFYLAVAFAAWWGGIRAAVLAWAAGLVLAPVFFIEPAPLAYLFVPSLVYTMVCGVMMALVAHARRSQLAALESARSARAAEAEIMHRNVLLAGLAESVLDAILIVSAEGRMLYANARFREVWGFPADVLAAADEAVALGWAETRVAEPRAFREVVAAAYTSGAVVRDELRMRDGRVYERFGAPVEHAGEKVGWVWTLRDITRRTQDEARLRESREHLRHVLDNLYAFVAVLTPAGVVTEVNRAPLDAGALAEADVLGRPLWECPWWTWADEWRDRVHDAVERAQRGESVRFDALMRVAGDAQIWIDLQVAPLRDGEGRITHLVASAMDITGRKRAEEALHESEQRFYRAFADAPIGMALTGLDGRLEAVNRAYCALTGYSEAELLGGMSFLDLTHGDDVGANRADLRRMLDGEISAFHIEKRYVHKDGRIVWVRASASLRRDAQGRPFQLVGIVEDIDERKRAEASLRQATTLLSAISDTTGDVIFAKDLAGRLTFANPATLALVGAASPEEALGRTDAELLNDAEAARVVMENDRRIMETGEAEDLEEVVPLPDGARHVWYSRKTPYRDAEGRVIGLLGVSREITERKQAEDAMRRSERSYRELAAALGTERAKLSAVIDNLPVGVGIGDVAGDSLFMNKAGLRVHGFDAEADPVSPLRRYFDTFELRAPDGRVLAREEWPACRAVRGEYVREFEAWLHNLGTGHVRYVAYDVAPVRAGEGAANLVVYLIQDLTEQKRAEDALARAKDALAEHSANLERMVAQRTRELTDTVHELEAFSYSLSHDMRAPLRAMKGFSQILQADYGDRLGEEGTLYLGKISRAAGRLDQLIQDVLTYSRIVGEQIQLQPIDVERLAHQLVEENPALQPPRASITIGSPLHPVLGHEAYLMQVLSNLVYNAVKFVAPGQEPRVHIWTEADDTHVRLFVRDEGIGIAPEAQERIFGMFQRMHSDRAYEGTGIGLTIVRKAVERMGGHVAVESEPGRGSTFSVELRRP